MLNIADKVKLRPGSPSWRRLLSRREKVADIEQLNDHDGFSTADILYPDGVRVNFIPFSDLVKVE